MANKFSIKKTTMKLLKVIIMLNFFYTPIIAINSYNLTSFVHHGPKDDCGNKICVRKCCQPNYHISGASCVFSNVNQFSVSVYQENQTVINDMSTFSIISGIMECANTKRYRLYPKTIKEDEFLIQTDGRLYHPLTKTYIDYDKYCVDYFDDINFSAIICASSEFRIGRGLNFIGMLVSMPFLFATFIIYLLLPEKNLHGNSLMSYVLALFFAYLTLVIVQLKSKSLGTSSCAILGSFCLFFFMASFFWMNVISLDIWWTFSGSRGFAQRVKEEEKKRFLQYSAYAWGAPLLMVILVISISFGASPMRWFNPGLGKDQCWFKDKITELFYFYGPIGILIIANIVLFVRTYLQIRSVHQATANFRKNNSGKEKFESDKQRFNVYLKLMMAMGINWSMEFISWMVSWQVQDAPAFLWYLTDFCNALYGVFIFFMFVFKKSILRSLKARYYMITGKSMLAQTLMRKSDMTPTTTETSL